MPIQEKFFTLPDNISCKQTAGILLAVFLLGTGLYLPTATYDFVWDDNIVLKYISQTESPSAAAVYLTSNVYVGRASIFYRPLFTYSFLADYILFKQNPWGYHLTNALLHGLAAALVAYLALIFFQSPYTALIAGGLFALHPAHTETVAFLSARSDLLYTLFSLLALVFMVKQTKPGRRDWNSRLWAPLFFFLALLSKDTAGVILVLMVFWLYQKDPEPAGKIKRTALKIMPSALMLIPYFLLRYAALKTSAPKMNFSLFHSPFYIFELSFYYLTSLIFPLQQAPYFFNAPQLTAYPLGIKFWLMAAFTLLVLGLIIYFIYRRRETAFFFALIILPCLAPLVFALTLNIIMVDRYLYLPAVGLALLAAWGFLQVPADKKKWASLGLGLVLLLYLGGTLWRMPLWKNDLVLFEALKKADDQAPYVLVNLGMANMKRNRFPEAYREFSRLVELYPGEFSYRNHLGWLYLRTGEIAQAREAFALSLKLAPDNLRGLEGLGLTYAVEGNYNLALKYLDQALAFNPGDEMILKNKADVLARQRAVKK